MSEVRFRSPFGDVPLEKCVGLDVRHHGSVIGKIVRVEDGQLVAEVGNVEFLGEPIATTFSTRIRL